VRGQGGVHCFVFCKVVLKFLRFWFSCNLRSVRRGLWLFSFDLVEMVFLRVWISARRVLASGLGFVCLCPGGCVLMSGRGWRECVL